MVKRMVFLCALAALVSAAASAQPSVNANGIVNAASSAPVGLPNSSIAQGSIFSIYGQNMGPAQSPELSWPLHAEEGLGGVTVQVQPAGGGQAVFAILLYVSPTIINAVLPSAVAPGQASVTVTYNGATSNAATFTVVQRSVGLFAWNQQGSGPGVVQNYHGSTYMDFNRITNSAMPGDVGVLWGTGLGPVTFDEKNPPPSPSPVDAGAEVWVGGQKATVQYQGRATFAGEDQINFTVPNNVVGCYVPVYVKVNGIISNTVSMSIGQQAGMCSDAVSFSGLDPEKVKANGLKQGTITLGRTTTKISAQGVSMDSKADTATGVFSGYDWTQLQQSRGSYGVSTIGACTVLTFAGDSAPTTDTVKPTMLDAGAALTLVGPDAVTKTIPKSAQTGIYNATLSTSSSIPIPGQPAGTDYFTAGTYQVSGPGGANVGAFSASITLPEPMVWSNVDAVSMIARNTGLTVTWTGGAGMVVITGISMISDPQKVGAMFTCLAQASAGTFTVPADVLAALPASGTAEGVPTGFLMVGNTLTPVPFTASGLDTASLIGSFITMKNVAFQ